MAAQAELQFHIDSPLLRSRPLSQLLGELQAEPAGASADAEGERKASEPGSETPAPPAEVWLKMDALQPSGSFKIRGIGRLCARAAARGASRIVASSGGNAGLAAAYAGNRLGIRTTICIPESTPAYMAARLRAEGAEVRVHGANWNAADELARSLVQEAEEPGKVLYVHPFDDPELWAGHASLVHEVRASWGERAPPEAVVCVVGGGGLILGVLQGLDEVGWSSVPVLAVETAGAESFHASVLSSELVSIPEISSIAKSLGAKQVAPRLWERYLERPERIQSLVVSDRDAVEAIAGFADHHRVLVEPACAAGLALLYSKRPELRGIRSLLVVVCGGNQVTLDALEGWKRELGVEHRSEY